MRWHYYLAAALGLSLAAGGAPAATAEVLSGETVAPEPSRGDFSFRRVRPPEPGGPRITVQIDAEEQARLLALPLLPPPAAPLPGHPGAAGTGPPRGVSSDFDWFWQEVDPAIDGPPGRFQTALAALSHPSRSKNTPAPRLQHLQEIAARHGPEILQATIGTRVSPALVLAVIAIESSGRVDAVSHRGAQGLMQLIPATADRFGVADAAEAGQNIRGGVAYLDWLLKEFDQDLVLALAGYNAGENAVRRNGGVPPFAETRAYVPKVLAAWLVARGLCVTPPELPGDGCVFRVVSSASH